MAEPRGIDLSSNDYLCLAQDPRLKEAMIEGVRRYGAGSTASRLLRGHRDVFDRVESEFSRLKGTERSLYFSTGYQANLGIFQTFLEEGDAVFSDELNHASIIDGIRLSKAEKVIFNHGDVEDLRSRLCSVEVKGQKFVVTESLFSMDGDIAPLKEYAAICRETGANLIVDEAHAVGIYGRKGSGMIEETGIWDDVFVSINTAGKALGVAGAFVSGDEQTIEYLVQRCRSFIFSTAPPPAVAYALSKVIGMIEMEEDRRTRLMALSALFGGMLSEAGFPVRERPTQIVPIVIGRSEEAVAVASKLQEAGFDVRAIRPPTVPEGTARLRISLNTGVSEADLERLVILLKDIVKKEIETAFFV
ncbi:MAG: 8-amino-7-oxononanoate synthase [Acidobacteria bacterium]|nr:MAG: 8-amino-7-oxononanoate synthase [Acidobacteriota bacterium]REK02506.1 MAG: 8-amino-7-oxononanoate synthase [Acidobacteriota bacterium]REK13692.1 MAG: 8-amino-7-oxononanoate synthase [Acidobacteriota bacterium]REK41686.1 MAG: 8-amino-7-oxononanoate synthase [Acidobacteriota bacterium]